MKHYEVQAPLPNGLALQHTTSTLYIKIQMFPRTFFDQMALKGSHLQLPYGRISLSSSAELEENKEEMHRRG
jgi:hypothetical protein